MTTFTAIVTSHGNERGLRSILGQLRYQTRKPDETIVFYSRGGAYDELRLREDFPEASFHSRLNRKDWGHEKRAEGVLAATSDWLGFFNDDDTYTADYVEKMLTASNGVDAVWCWWNGRSNGCRFALGDSTSGNFIVRIAVAREAGYTDRIYEADGTFIDRVAALAVRAAEVPEVLYRHNEQPA